MSEAVALARQSRTSALTVAGPGRWGWADLGVLRAQGRDAVAFLQSQLTNDLDAVAVGGGQLSARVTRTGHLVAVFSAHRLPDPGPGEQAVLLVLPREDVQRLHDDLDAFVFADHVTFTDDSGEGVAFVAGPDADTSARALVPDWRSVEGEVHALDGGWLLRLGLTGDPVAVALGSAVPSLLGTVPPAADAESTSAAVDLLRIEAGLVRPAVDLPKKRLLPETGLEQHTVSYTKGCYLGQEVIARVRTYGSVPNALRAVVLPVGVDLPEPGTDLVDESGKKVGQAASSAFSVTAESPVLLAYLGRDHRTPGAELVLRLPQGLRTGRVHLLPLHRATDLDARVAALYDRAIRTFAEGDSDGALALLEQALRLDASFADGYEALGVILGRGGRFHEAIDFFKRLEEVVPAEPLVNTNLSLYYMKLGDKETAETQSALAARKAMARGDGETRTAGELAAQAEQARRADAARKERMFRQVLDFDPVDPIALFGLGTALSTLERWDEAATALEQASQADGKNSAVFLAWGKALERLDRPAQAVDVYVRGIEVASRRGDLMPLKEMESRKLLLGR